MSISEDEFIKEILQKILTPYFKNLEDEELRRDSVPYFISHPLPVSFESEFAEAEISLPLSEITTRFIYELNQHISTLSVSLESGAIEIKEEVPEQKALLKYFLELALVYLLTHMRAKMAWAMDTLCKEAILVSLQIGRVRAGRKLESIGVGTPLEIDMRPLLNDLMESEAANNRNRIAKQLDGFEGLKVLTHRGRPPKWTKERLESAVFKAVTKISKRHTPTLRDVAREISKAHPSSPPLTANSLRKSLKRFKIDWKAAKRS